VVVADFNGDGKPDLAGIVNGQVEVLLGNGDGTFQPEKTTSINAPVSLVAADFNGDGTADLAVVYQYYPTGGVSILLSNGDGTFRMGPPVTLPSNAVPSSAAAGDFNGDGRPDLAVPLSNHTVAILLGEQDGAFHAPILYPVGPEPSIAAVADFNGDGIPDLAVADWQTNLVSVLVGKGNGAFTVQALSFGTGAMPPPQPGGVQAMTVVDFNGDGKPDLASVNLPLNGVTVLTNTTP
jgi:hypothetical protein